MDIRTKKKYNLVSNIGNIPAKKCNDPTQGDKLNCLANDSTSVESGKTNIGLGLFVCASRGYSVLIGVR